jgi:hypothetical protein
VRRLAVGVFLVFVVSCTISVQSDLDLKSDGTSPERELTLKDDPDASRGEVLPGRQVDDAAEQGVVDAGDGGTASLYVLNLATESVCWIYADPCGSESTDLLGTDVLQDDWYLTVEGLQNGCYNLWAFPCSGDGLWYSKIVDLEDEFTWILVPGVSFLDTATLDSDTDPLVDTDDLLDTDDLFDTADTGDTFLE